MASHACGGGRAASDFFPTPRAIVGRGRVVGVNIDGRRWRLYHRGLAAPELQLPGVKFDAGVKKTAFPGFISRFIFVTDLLRKQSAKNPESMRISVCPVVNCPQPLVV